LTENTWLNIIDVDIVKIEKNFINFFIYILSHGTIYKVLNNKKINSIRVSLEYLLLLISELFSFVF
jgi:hypothetical protein